jgi:hypothetical protein
LQLSITDSNTGVRRANYMGDGTLVQIEGNGALINAASADLLDQLGVRLTNTGRQELLAGNASAVKAEAGLARGISAQSAGQEVSALLNFSQSVAFDPSQMEAISRLTSLSSTISGGSLGERIQNDMVARNRWIEAFRETASFLNDHPPFEIIFDPNLVQVGETDFSVKGQETAVLGMRIALNPSEAGFNALNALLEGLEKTGRRDGWGFSGWPLQNSSPKTSGTVVFKENSSLNYKVNLALINENGKTLGRSSITLNTGKIAFSPENAKVVSPAGDCVTVPFSNIKAVDLTPTLTIAIVAVNGIPSSQINATSYMRIATGDLEAKAAQYALLAQRRKEQKNEKVSNALGVIGGIGGLALGITLIVLLLKYAPEESKAASY